MQPDIGIVYKYFDLLDGFIRVRSLAEDQTLALPAGLETPPDRRQYRHMVVQSCVVRPEEILSQVQRIYPEDLRTAEDLLYQICIDVNPHLEIHNVVLPATMEADALPAASPQVIQDALQSQASKLERRILKDIVGQDEAVHTLCRSVRKAACGLNDPKRPVGTYLFVGRTGCGKTELAKSLARNLYGEASLIRIDCSEYALPHESAKLIGAPPGYIGHNEGGVLTEALKKNRQAIVLFDEIEKGHEKMHNMLLQILDEGRLTDSKGETVDFTQCLVLLTSNVGTQDYAQAKNRLGFGEESLSRKDFEDLTQAALTRSFKPELLNRLDGCLTFRSLSKKDCARIAHMQLNLLQERVKQAGIHLRWTPMASRVLAEIGYSEEYGAREVRRTVARLVEEPLSNAILDGEIKKGEEWTLRSLKGCVEFKKAA
ncbi:MAG: AAA family ATPase [Planctomycetota bacterium]|nr:AAA family ATPase [Planctomycetota bacterium]